MAKMNWTRAHQVDTRIREGLDASAPARGESPRDRRIRAQLAGTYVVGTATRTIPHSRALARLLARPLREGCTQ